MITAVYVERLGDKLHTRLACKEVLHASAVVFTCGACLNGRVTGAVGDICICGARVVAVTYDSPDAALAAF